MQGDDDVKHYNYNYGKTKQITEHTQEKRHSSLSRNLTHAELGIGRVGRFGRLLRLVWSLCS